MKINISRQSVYILLTTIILFVFVLLFSFLVLIPEGQDYRQAKTELSKENNELRKYQYFHDETLDRLKKLQAKNIDVITALDSKFNPERFVKQHKKYFNTLELSKGEKTVLNEDFVLYEVNTSSQINSPKSFYDFLDAVNKSDWVIGVEFPIHFKRDSEMIHSSFTMKVHCVNKDSNSSK